MTPTYSPTDALLHASASEAGKDEIDEYLCASGLNPGKKCFKRVLRRIRHSELYTNGILTVKARILAAVLLVVLACGFAVLGFCVARIVDDIFTVRDIEQYFSIIKDSGKSISPIISEYREPCVGNRYTRNVLVKSSQIYNVEYSADDVCIYYTQTPVSASADDKQDETSNKGLYVLVNGNKALVCITMTDSGKLFEISWSDTQHSYMIFGTKAMEDAVQLAQSIYKNTESNAKAE